MTASFCFFDWETRSNLDLTEVGTLNYVLDESTEPLLLSWATDDAPVKLWCPDLEDVLHPDVRAYVLSRVWCYGDGKPRNEEGVIKGAPAEITDLSKNPSAYFVAWNAAFDRHVWQQVAAPYFGFPDLRTEQFLDSMAQAQASNLPGSLDMAGRALNLGAKTVGGKAIMKRFADAKTPLPGDKSICVTEKDVKDAIAAWELYLDYSVQDTELMRQVWQVTRPLDAAEWAEYWVSEKINDRGIMVDLDVCRGAVKYREEELAFVAEEIGRLTEGKISGPTFTKQINDWIYDRLPDDLAETMVRERDEEGYVTRLTGDKNVVTRLLEDIQVSDTPPADEVVELLELLQFGRSSSAVKFEKMLNQSVDGRLCGSYVFNGAGQTGRSCLAEGSLLLVRTLDGVIEQRPIEQLSSDEQLWDGDQWVEHEGIVFSGVKDVFEYDGVEATVDHKVYVTDTDYTTLLSAAERGIGVYKGTDPCTQYTK